MHMVKHAHCWKLNMNDGRKFSRREVIAGLAATAGVVAANPGLAASGTTSSRPASPRPEVLVVGAGVFGAWTAWHLQRLGKRVLLVDAWDPGHTRSSSGGESRMTRTGYGGDAVYTSFAWESLDAWRWISSKADLPLFHPMGVLFMCARVEPYIEQTLEVHRRLRIPIETLDQRALQRRYPQMNVDGIEIALYERDRGALMARRSVEILVREFVAAGGEYRRAAIVPPTDAATTVLDGVQTVDGEWLHADSVVFACGPWLPRLFPGLLTNRIFPTRQEVYFLATPAGDDRFSVPRLPGWADFNDGDVYYGFPDLEGRGVKVARDHHGPAFDPDGGDRIASAQGLNDIRTFLRRRFPALAERPLAEARVCQYENSSNGDFLIDRHPAWSNVWLVGAGSGHGFKHGPAVGRYAAQLITGSLAPSAVEPRFSLATKGEVQHRSVL
jgi:monomeric sarcosine oxidase